MVELHANMIDSLLCSIAISDIKIEFFSCGAEMKIKIRSDKQIGNRIWIRLKLISVALNDS